ncbi:MAG: hypothetical protein RBT63_07920 [Bdellovibrionales bacterium]|jgi:hypothetical protein|nr:hypothetical protein [Bdellovibrionales bacterium]
MKNSTSKNKISKKTLTVMAVMVALLVVETAHASGWKIDLSRRTRQMRTQELLLDKAGRDSREDTTYGDDRGFRSPASVRAFDGEPTGTNPGRDDRGFVDRLFDPGAPSQDIVIMNTERGFVPNTIRVRKDGRYTVHIVNVNEKEKNVSFILDGFAEHHATYFGKVKSFVLEPRKDGVYSFISPETASEGRLIVYAHTPSENPPKVPNVRLPSSAMIDMGGTQP